MMGWQWHQLDHMQIICILLRTDNHASTWSLNSHRPDALPDAQPIASNQSIEGNASVLANVHVRDLMLLARPSVVCLSVTLVHPTQAVVNFGYFSTAFGTLAIH